MASAASLVHGGSPTTLKGAVVRPESAVRRGGESVRTTEQLQVPGEQDPQTRTGARKQEAGNGDLSHLMQLPAGTTSPAKKKKLTLHAVSNT